MFSITPCTFIDFKIATRTTTNPQISLSPQVLAVSQNCGSEASSVAQNSPIFCDGLNSNTKKQLLLCAPACHRQTTTYFASMFHSYLLSNREMFKEE